MAYVTKFDLQLVQKSILDRLAKIEEMLLILAHGIRVDIQEGRIARMATQQELDALSAAVAANTDAESAAAQALDGLVASVADLTQKLNDAVNSGDSAAIQAATAALTAGTANLKAHIPALAAAVVAGT